MLIFSMGRNSRKGGNSDKKKIWVSYFSMRNPCMKFQNPSKHGSFGFFQFSKGHNSRKGDDSDKKKKTCQIFFHEESIHEISKP